MADEISTRRIFAVFQVVLGLVVPALFASSLLGNSSLGTIYQLAYWLGIPAVCFSVLAFLSLSRRANQFRLTRSGMWGAALAGYLAFLLPATLLWLTTGENYRGGGANIGVALLVYAMPLYLPVVMIAGLSIGGSLGVQGKHISTQR